MVAAGAAGGADPTASLTGLIPRDDTIEKRQLDALTGLLGGGTAGGGTATADPLSGLLGGGIFFF